MGQNAKPRSPVMSDVAQLAGVSHQTVSRVLHDSPSVRAETRAKVLDAMKQLDYRPNSAARALVTGRTRTLGVISFDTTLYGPASTVLGIERAAHDAGYFIIIVSLPSLTRDSVRGAIDRLRDRGVDGIVVIAPQETAAAALRDLPPGVPVVAAEAGPDTIPVAEVDQVAGARLATQHLIDLGHRAIFHIAGPTDFLEARKRVVGWRAALQEAGLDAPAPLVGDWSARAGHVLGHRLLTEHPEATAVFVANDPMALGLLRAMAERGLDAPAHLSIVGFDGVPEAEYFCPPLTTVRQDFDEIGRQSLALLLEQVQRDGDGGGVAGAVVVAPELVVRESTAPPRKDAA